MILYHIFSVRRKSGITQKQLSDATGISRDRLIRIESGEGALTIDEFETICRCLKIKVILIKTEDLKMKSFKPVNIQFEEDWR